MLPKPPGRVDRSNLESLKEHHVYADQLCKLNFKLTFIVALCALSLLYIHTQHGDIAGLEIPFKLLQILMPLVTILLIALQSFVMYYRKTFKTLIEQYPSK
ncbi:hypothetical protein [Acinetobacter sp. YH12153]|uniref:hypothetical protein n=1 Tax=Acinetobacter sp. YH12153 TaxID=2601133 RepID=UPI0015D2D745|nr:hypothetical protein [Acinetobacter sp. YH12153]